MQSTIAIDLVIVLATALAGGVLALYFKQAVISGYLLAGLFLGSYFITILRGIPNLEFLAQVGVALLMFSVGIEFSFERIARVKKTVLYGALLQIVIVIILGFFFFSLLHFSPIAAVVMGIAFSMSSTTVVAKILSQTEKLETLEGEITLGWFIIQDLALIPLIIIISATSQGGSNVIVSFFIAAVKSVVVLGVVYVLGMEFVPKLLNKLADLHVHEVVLLAVVLLWISCSFLTGYFGLSYALGAFIAGLIVSKGFLNHQIALEIRPLRDVFAMLFFVSVGALLQPRFVLSSLFLICCIVLLIIAIKFISTVFLTRAFGNHGKIAFFVASHLTPIGEFAFIIASTSKALGLIDSYTYAIILSVSLITIILTPFIVKLNPYIFAWAEKTTKQYAKPLYKFIFLNQTTSLDEDVILPFVNVVICGYGRVGRNVGEILQTAGIGFSIVDFNKSIIEEAKRKNIHAVYGDASNPEILTLASIENAKIILITIPDPIASEVIVKNALLLNTHIKVMARSHLPHHKTLLEDLGVHFIVEPEYEAALSIINRLMKFLGKTKKERQLWLSRGT